VEGDSVGYVYDNHQHDAILVKADIEAGAAVTCTSKGTRGTTIPSGLRRGSWRTYAQASKRKPRPAAMADMTTW
jgi:hypothetical protein